MKREEDIAFTLRNFVRTPSNLTGDLIKELVERFPFRSSRNENLNHLTLKVLRTRPDLVPRDFLAHRLGVSGESVDAILREDMLAVYFPVSDGNRSFLNRALVIPLPERMTVTFEPLSEDAVRTLVDLTGRGFLLTFERNFDFRSNSYMLSVYSALRWGRDVLGLAFTGVLSRSGKIEDVKHIRQKLRSAKERGIPLVFPSECMKDLRDLENFLTELRIPVSILLGTGSESFNSLFPFSPDYIRTVFHLEKGLSYDEAFDNTPESFRRFKEWIDGLSLELKRIFESFPRFRVAVASKVLVLSFYAGVSLSKGYLPVEFYTYMREKDLYERVYEIRNDKDIPGSPPEDIVSVERRGDRIENIVISLKSGCGKRDNALLIEAEEIPERYSKELAYRINSLIRRERFERANLVMEGPNSLFFALGYYLEDYKNITLMHRGVPLWTLGKDGYDTVYLLSSFSLNMLPQKKAFVDLEPITLSEAKELLRGNVKSYVGHASTARVLSELFGPVAFNRENVVLPSGSVALVFQINRRPREGQVFTEEEIREIFEEGLFSIWKIRVYH